MLITGTLSFFSSSSRFALIFSIASGSKGIVRVYVWPMADYTLNPSCRAPTGLASPSAPVRPAYGGSYPREGAKSEGKPSLIVSSWRNRIDRAGR